MSVYFVVEDSIVTYHDGLSLRDVNTSIFQGSRVLSTMISTYSNSKMVMPTTLSSSLVKPAMSITNIHLKSIINKYSFAFLSWGYFSFRSTQGTENLISTGRSLVEVKLPQNTEENNLTVKAAKQSITNKKVKPYSSTFYEISLYPNWSSLDFLVLFLFASFCGSLLNYATFLCTSYNSALTTSVIGCLKNVATTYIGMIIFDDYIFSWVNFIGLNLSIIGSLYYTYITLFKGFSGFGGG